MSTFEYSNLIFIKWRSGSVSDPYIDLTESRKIVKNMTVLQEVPDEEYRVRISGYTEKTMEQYIKTKTIATNEFVVNYNIGYIMFNESKNGQTITAIYKGKGVILYPAERIYYDHPDSETIIKTLQQLATLGEIALANVGDLEDLQNKIDLAVATANNLVSGITDGTILYTNLGNRITVGNTTKTNLDTSITNAGTAKTNLDGSISNAASLIVEIATGQQLKIDLNALIATANTTKTNLDGSITTGNTTKTNLDGSISTAGTTKTNLDASNVTANTTKTNLDASNTTANTTKTNLDASNTTANTTRTNLNTSITNAGTAKTNLDASISTATTTKTNLDTSIATGNDLIDEADDINTTLNGSVETGQSKIVQMDAKLTEATTAIGNTNTATTTANDVAARLSVFEPYSGSKVYKPLNKVAYSGSSYVCILQTTAGTLPSNTTYWMMIAQAGSGNVSSVNGDATGDIISVNPSSNVVLSLNTGIGASKIVKLDGTGHITADILVSGSTNVVVSATEKSTWNAKASTSVVTTSVNGLMISTDKSKLDNIAANANNYVHPSGDGSLHVPATSTTNNGKVLKAGATAGSLSWASIAFSELTSTPTTLAGYGITDASGVSNTYTGNTAPINPPTGMIWVDTSYD